MVGADKSSLHGHVLVLHCPKISIDPRTKPFPSTQPLLAMLSFIRRLTNVAVDAKNPSSINIFQSSDFIVI